MYCSKCGKELDDDADVCTNCGKLVEKVENKSNKIQSEIESNKTGIGVLLGLFLGLIGLIIGVCMYPTGSVERQTFLKGWGISFAIAFGIGFIIGFIGGLAGL